MDDGGEPELELILKRRGKRVLLVAAVVLGLAAVYPVANWLLKLHAVSQEDQEVALYTPQQAILNGVDLAAVHGELLPAWFVAEGARARRPADADSAWEAVRAAVDSDARLARILDDLRDTLGWEDRAEALIRQNQLIDEWNAYLNVEARRPWALKLPMSARSRLRQLFAMSYFLLGNLRVAVGARIVPARLATRVDDLNVRELYLGHAADESGEAFVIVDQVADVAADQLWPLLDPNPEDQAHWRQNFAGPVSAEVARLLPEDWLAPLRETARTRWNLVHIRAAVNARGECGSLLRLRRVPLRGVSDALLTELRPLATSRRNSICPEITYAELDLLEEGSRQLRETPGIRYGVHGLTALLARSVTVHEVRHVLDFDEPPACPACPAYLGDDDIQELSAFLAAFASTEAPYTALFQACVFIDEGDRRSSHGRAISHAIARLTDHGCDGPLPDDLSTRARSLEMELFGRSDAIPLPPDFPERIRSRWYP